MISCRVQRSIKAAGRNLVLAFATVPGTLLAQPVSSPATPETPRALVEKIEEVQSLHGIQSPELIDPLGALALWYQNNGEPDLATAAIERTRQVVKANYGLYSLEEALLIRQLVQIEEARGNASVAWSLEQALLALVTRHPADLRRVALLREIAKKRVDVLARYQRGEFPPQIVLGCYYSEALPDGNRSGCHAGNMQTVISALSLEADEYLTEANDTFGQPYFSSCRKPHRPESLDQPQRYERNKSAAKKAEAQYLSALSDYIVCVQAEDRRADE